MNPCPDAAQMERFLAECLSPDEDATLAEHVEQCGTCQGTLEQLTLPPHVLATLWNAPAVPRVTASDRAGPTSAFVDRMKAQGPGRVQRNGTLVSSAPQFADYEILAELGHGGMGIVYKARDTRLNRIVTLKMIRAGAYASAEELRRFRTETEAIAQLQHPHIVQIFNVGTHDELPYCVLEFVERGSLASTFDGTPWSGPDAARFVVTLAGAVQAAHERGIVHRDLKPANVLLGPDGQPKITDFGLAKTVSGSSQQTHSGAILGTPSYMSPEQAGSRHEEVGPATDVYALGAILYELLTGRPPFKGPTPLDTIQYVAYSEPVNPRKLQPGIPRDLETITLKCLAKRPNQRYQAAGDLATDLGHWLAGEPINARSQGAITRYVKWVKRRPAISGLVAVSAAALLIFVGGVVALLYNAELQVAVHETARARDALDIESKKTTAALTRAETFLYFHRIALAEREWHANNPKTVVQLLQDCPIPARGWEWNYLQRLCHSEVLTLHGHNQGVLAIAFSPDGTIMASAGKDKAIKIWEVSSGRELKSLVGHTQRVTSLAFGQAGAHLFSTGEDATVRVWDPMGVREGTILGTTRSKNAIVAVHPKGHMLAVADGSQVVLWDAATGNRFHTFEGHADQVTCVAFSPDGTRLASGSRDRSVRIWHAVSGALLHTYPVHKNTVFSVTFHPNGRWCASASADKSVKVWDVATGKILQTYRGFDDGVLSVSFSPKGNRLAAGTANKLIKIWDVSQGRQLADVRAHFGDVTQVAFSPDGSLVASASFDGTVKIWKASEMAELQTLLGHTHNVHALAWCSRTNSLASAGKDEKIQIWNMKDGAKVNSIPTAGIEVYGLAFSPDGQTLAGACHTGGVRIWDVNTGKVVLQYDGHNNVVTSVAFHPRGHRVASVGLDQAVHLWDPSTAACIHVMPAEADLGSLVAFNREGTYLAGPGLGNAISLWDPETGSETASLHGHAQAIRGLAFSQDGKRLASAGKDEPIKVWDLTTQRILLTLRGHQGHVRSLAFSPDGFRLASGGTDSNVTLWDLDAAVEALRLRGHTNDVACVLFSPDGHLLVSASHDRTIRVWNGKPVK